MKNQILAIGIWVLSAELGHAAVWNAASCSQPDVAAAVASAADGDTVNIPACPAGVGWSAQLSFSKAITLQGAGIGQTVLIDNTPKGSPTCGGVMQMIVVNVPTDLPWRLTGFTLQGGATDPQVCNVGHIGAGGRSHRFRIDHIAFANMQSSGIRTYGDLWGVIDHNTFSGSHKQGVLVFHDQWGGVGFYGDNSWATPDTMGTERAIFIEDNVFDDLSAQGAGAFDSFAGGRLVFRHNTAYFIGSHGTESGGRFRSIRQYEVYDNTFTSQPNGTATMFYLRGGTGVIFNNAYHCYNNDCANNPLTGMVTLENDRDRDPFNPWGYCDGASPWDNNDGIVYSSGQHNGTAGSTTLTDTSKSFSNGQWTTGYSVRNLSAGWSSAISGNTATTITSQGSIYGTSHAWNPGDSYQIVKANPCMDMVGHGAGDLISGDTPINTITGNASWPREISDPIYQWSNNFLGNTSPTIGTQTLHAQAGREWIDNTPKPGYTPYCYPHPLISGMACGTTTAANVPARPLGLALR